MDAGLRELQAPLEQRQRDAPDSARTMIAAQARVAREAPVGLGVVSVDVEVDTDADDATLARLGELTERYCVAAQSLAHRPELTVRRAS